MKFNKKLLKKTKPLDSNIKVYSQKRNKLNIWVTLLMVLLIIISFVNLELIKQERPGIERRFNILNQELIIEKEKIIEEWEKTFNENTKDVITFLIK